MVTKFGIHAVAETLHLPIFHYWVTSLKGLLKKNTSLQANHNGGEKVHREGTEGNSVALLFLYHMRWSTPRPGRFTPGKETQYPLYRGLDGSHCRSRRVRKISHHRDSIPGPCSLWELPYRLRIMMTLLLLLLLLLLLPLPRHHHREAPELYRLTEQLTRICQPRALYIVPLALSIIGIILFPSKETIRQFETAQSSLCSIYSHAESNSNEYMPCI